MCDRGHTITHLQISRFHTQVWYNIADCIGCGVNVLSRICALYVMESIIRDAIIDHMKSNKSFSPKQFGFITGRSTVLQLLHVLNIWSEILDPGGNLDVIYCDFMKAFDKVPHKRLIYKTNKYGISGNVLGWISSFLNDRTQCVNINNVTSESAPVTSGIPQGSVLGPLLFVMYINDLPEVVDSKSFVFLFADDTKVFREINSEQDVNTLQKDIDNLLNWSNKWLLKFHPDKCVYMEVGHGNETKEQHKYSMGGHNLSKSACEKDIGVDIDPHLQFETHINNIVNKANRILAIARKTFDCMDRVCFSYILKGLVRPQLEYAAPIWSPHLIKLKEIIENVQRRATKMVPGLSSLTYPERLRELNIPTLAYRRIRGDMIQVYKLTSGAYDKDFPTLLEKSTTGLRGNVKKLFIDRANKDIRKYNFSIRVRKIWNSLPNHVVNAESIESFEKGLDHHWKDQEVMYDNFKDEIKL